MIMMMMGAYIGVWVGTFHFYPLMQMDSFFFRYLLSFTIESNIQIVQHQFNVYTFNK